MAAEIIKGAVDKPVSTEELIKCFKQTKTVGDGILYIGYPIVGTIADKTSIDAIYLSQLHGIIVFDLVEDDKLDDRTENRIELYNALFHKLIANKELVAGRGELKVSINVVSFIPIQSFSKTNNLEVITNQESFENYLNSLIEKSRIEEIVFRKLLQVIQAITRLKLSPNRSVKRPNSRADILRNIEKSVAVLDGGQSRAVIETVEGIQRIRGLAGSGKTIVLALKVAYLHAKFPDWKIAVTFYTRSLKSQFYELITRFSLDQKNEEPNWDNIRILQSWGSPSDSGLYYEYCYYNNLEYLDFEHAKSKFMTTNNLMDLICKKAKEDLGAKQVNPVYDAILVDEAQDFSESFLQICFDMLKPIKVGTLDRRLIYAYDELQKLNNEKALRNPKDMFPGVSFGNSENNNSDDIILNKCYRNSKQVLVTAHALGFGIYRSSKKLVTMFKDKELWIDVGYKAKENIIELGSDVTLYRDNNSSPDFLTKNIENSDLIIFKNFNSVVDQSHYIVEEIIKNITTDELSYRDILVIHPNSIRAREDWAIIRNELANRKIRSHIAGVTTSPDKIFEENSIALTSILRAKGNEAPMVYIIHADYCYDNPELIKKRNILFSAITRSKAWVRVCGIGEGMINLSLEYQEIVRKNYELSFRYPTEDEMKNLNILHRDLTEEKKKIISTSNSSIEDIISKIETGEIYKEDINDELKEKLRQILYGNK